jgi:hypothetical protein
MEALIEALGRRGIEGRALIPWYYPTPDEYRALLEANGFAVDSIALIPRPTTIPGDLADWLDTFAGSFLSAVALSDRDTLKREVAERLAPKFRDRSGKWTLDYVRLRVVAHL